MMRRPALALLLPIVAISLVACAAEPAALPREAPSTAVPTPPSAAPEAPTGETVTLSEPAEEAPAGPATEILSRGQFRDRDARHQGSGTAALERSGDQLLLHLTDFMVSDGPDLFVWLVENPETYDPDALGATLDLGPLQALSGDQAYTIPPDTDLSPYGGVIVYCRAFRFVFSTAPLTR